MIRWLARKKVRPVNVMPGDMVMVLYRGEDGRRETVTVNVDRIGSHDTLAIGEIEDEIGFSAGVVGVVGREGIDPETGNHRVAA